MKIYNIFVQFDISDTIIKYCVSSLKDYYTNIVFDIVFSRRNRLSIFFLFGYFTSNKKVRPLRKKLTKRLSWKIVR